MVISTVNQVVYNGDGVTTAFPFTFRIIEATDIKLLLIDADGAETDITADYYVDKVNNTVYYPGYAPGAEPPAEDQPPKVQTGQKLVVYRELPITQEKDLDEKWPFYVIELGLDKLTMILQQIFDWWGRTLKISQGGSVDGFDTNIYPEAGKVVSVNDAGNGFTSVTAMLEENNAWEGKGLQIHNIAGPSSVTDAVTKDYVDQILNGFVLAGDSRTVPFDTLAQLRAADIAAGQIAFTLGYYDVNDGGAGVYNIRTATVSDVDDGGSIIILDNGNVAELIIGESVNVHQFGAKGNANYYKYTDGNSYVNADTSSATAANYIDNVTTDIVKNYVSATFETEGTYLNPADGKHYVNYDSDTDTYTDEAPYHDNVADKWYVSATYSNKANALLDGTWYYGVVFSTPAQDDTTAIQNAINTHKPIELLHGHTYIVTSFTVYNGLVLNGNGGVLRRPNLKLAPYEYNDNTIKWLRMFNLTAEVVGENVNNVLTEIRDITIDSNAFAMWNPLTDNSYKYEQGVAFPLSGTSAHPCRVLFDNVRFLNEYASSITVNNYVDIIMQNCSAWNCMKGVCTIVGDANNVNISNALCDSDYGFTALWYEPNTNIDGKKSTININNAIFYGRFECITNKNAVVNVANSLMHMSSADFVIGQYAILNIVNSAIVMTTGNNIAIKGYGKLLVENCDIAGGGLAFVNTASNDYYVTCLIANSVLHDSAVGIVVYENTQSDVSVNGCRFEAISTRCFGVRVGATKSNFKRFVVTNCVFDVECYIYQSNSDTNLRTVTFGGGNDVVNASNQGIYIYGADAITMKDEMWSVPVKIVTYRSGSTYNPIGFGYRMTLVDDVPTFRGVNDIDHAQLTVSPYTKYSYTGDAWVEDA